MVARVSARLLPFTAVDIIDADDWLIEHPWPVSLTSASRSPSIWRYRVISSPHRGLNPVSA